MNSFEMGDLENVDYQGKFVEFSMMQADGEIFDFIVKFEDVMSEYNEMPYASGEVLKTTKANYIDVLTGEIGGEIELSESQLSEINEFLQDVLLDDLIKECENKLDDWIY